MININNNLCIHIEYFAGIFTVNFSTQTYII